MRYAINFNRMVNQLVPHYLGGRRLILFLQSCVYPLQSLNNHFVEWAKETRIEFCMTSQVIMLEWFLTRKFKYLFENTFASVKILNGVPAGIPIYYESATDIPEGSQLILFRSDEDISEKQIVAFPYYDEKPTDMTVSFVVRFPKIKLNTEGKTVNGLAIREVLAQLRYWIDRYRLAGKTYLIEIPQ